MLQVEWCVGLHKLGIMAMRCLRNIVDDFFNESQGCCDAYLGYINRLLPCCCKTSTCGLVFRCTYQWLKGFPLIRTSSLLGRAGRS